MTKMMFGFVCAEAADPESTTVATHVNNVSVRLFEAISFPFS